MKWQKARELYPNKFVVFKILESHVIGNKEYVDDVAVIKATGYGGTVCYAIRKRIDKISCGNLAINDFKLDFGVIDPTDKVNGLIGLDFLIGVG